MSFLVYRSNRLERLVEALALVVREPASPVDPLRPETVVVPSRALGRYLGYRLAEALGAWACPDFPFPRRVIDQALGAVLGDAEEAGESVFGEGRLIWAVARLLPLCLREEPEAFAPVRRYLESGAASGAGSGGALGVTTGAASGAGSGKASGVTTGAAPGMASGVAAEAPWSSARLLSLSAEIATVLDRYQVYRPDWILGWDRAPEDHWQSRLWHRLVATYSPPGAARATHLAARAKALEEALRARDAPYPGLPPRLHLFAIRTLPPLFLRIFASLAQAMDVHFYVLTPSPEYFADLRPADLASAEGATNPLLASMGRLGRELQELLEEHDYQEVGTWTVDPAPGLGAQPPGLGTPAQGEPAAAPSALTVVQSDVLRLRHRRPSGAPSELPLVLRPEDRSLAVHASFGPMREVEALRDQLLATFEELPDLQPRDVVVMAPDMDTYAPYVEAVFGVAPEDPAYLPYSISDRLPRAEQGVPDAFLSLLALLSTRLAGPDVMDLVGRAPVLERFGIPPEGIQTLTEWLSAAGIRWAVDAEDRAAHGQPPFREYTWRFGLDRLLMGYASAGDGWTPFGGVLPLPGPESAPELLGSLVELSEALFAARREAARPARPAEWQARLLGWLGAFCHEGDAYAWQHQLLRDALETLVADAALAGFDEPMELGAVRSLLEARVTRPSPPREFLSRGITFCSLLPMRSVPFRVVALLGLSEDQFPRQDRRPAFDLLSEAPRPGDPSPRQDDRYLFLEAVLAARERLILSYVGGDLRDQTIRPPSVLVSELLDTLADSFVVQDEAGRAGAGEAEVEVASGTALGRRRRLVERLVVRHPLRPFDPRYLAPVPSSGLFTYDRAQLRAARAHLGPKRPAPPFLSDVLPPVLAEERGLAAATARAPDGERVLPLESLERFWKLPCESLLRGRLGLTSPGEAERLGSREPTDLEDGLASFLVRDRLLGRLRAAGSMRGAWEALSAAGLLPLGGPGRAALEAQVARIEPVAALLKTLLGDPSLAPVPIALGLGDVLAPGSADPSGPLLLTGHLRGCLPGAQLLCRAGSVRAKDQLEAWIRHLALSALGDGRLPATTLVVGVGKEGRGATILRFDRLGAAEALDALGDLASLYLAGQRVPLRFFPQSSLAYVEGLSRGPEAALADGQRAFLPSVFGRGGSESEDPSVGRLFPSDLVLEEVTGPSPDGVPSEAYSFVSLSRRVFEPLLEARREGLA